MLIKQKMERGEDFIALIICISYEQAVPLTQEHKLRHLVFLWGPFLAAAWAKPGRAGAGLLPSGPQYKTQQIN